MLIETWLTLLVLSVAVISSFIYLFLSVRESNGMYFTFFLGMVGLSASRFLYFYANRFGGADYIRDYISIGAIAFLLVGLFIMIRDSKPAFARFPSSFTLLPLLIIPFYPLIGDKAVLRDLISMIIQGGGLIVALLIVSLKQLKSKGYVWLLIGLLLLILAYLFRWFFLTESNYNWVHEFSLSAGMIVCCYGFLKQSITTKKDLNND